TVNKHAPKDKETVFATTIMSKVTYLLIASTDGWVASKQCHATLSD
ncbi:MAG: hypothetical protein ACI9FJ_001630, partial [Alteromonadaceae bacterium]